ncbi:hypothetical protein PISMIDRAFT_13120 [Pisolithus microcarpus 441]|uniref:Uncharacterized protein n=1 Tax=Pisolithus microcarpus 441 TaxID=765257 RepID=A0A0C9YU69_9AGAM|nr:hypothetical protein PISMIDRAFT_13120 [Pisolithus microcarpus 441]
MREGSIPRKSNHLNEKVEKRYKEAREMASATEQSNKESPGASGQEDPMILESAEATRASTITFGEAPGFLSAVCKGYKSNSVLTKVMAQPSHYPQFEEEGGLLYMKNHGGEKVLCLPHAKYEGDNTITKVIDQMVLVAETQPGSGQVLSNMSSMSDNEK